MKSLRCFLTATLVTALFFSSLNQRIWALDNAAQSPPKDEIVARQAAGVASPIPLELHGEAGYSKVIGFNVFDAFD
jgi:hypothetical protein